ncbi:MAG: PQQ-binding-like beta-propeller repeat protein [Planctomycetaceae bacterium]
MPTVKPLIAVILLTIPAAAQDDADPADIDVQVEPLLTSLRNSIVQERWLDAAQSFDTAWKQLHDGEDQAPEVRFAGTQTLRPGQHQSRAGAREQLREIYRASPPAFRDEYQRQYDGAAQRSLQDALQRGDRREMLRLVQRYECCHSSATVVGYLVTDSMARGDPLNAAMILHRLPGRTAEPTTEMQMLLAELWLQAGFSQESQHAVRRLAERNGYGSTVNFRVRQLRLPDSPDAVAGWVSNELSFRVPEHPSTWLQPQGNAARTGLQEQQPARMTMAWQRTLFRSRPNSELNSKLQRLEQRVLSGVADAPISPARPIVTDDLVVFQGIGNLQAVSRSGGDQVWESSRFNRQLQSAITWADDQSQQFAARTLDHIVLDAPRNHIRGQLVSDGQFLFSVEETSQGPISAMAEPPPNVQALNFNVLRVYDVATGRLLGQAGGLMAPAKSGRTDPLAASCFLGAPLLLEDRILILVEDSHGIHLLDLRLRSESAAPDAEMQFEVVDRQLLSVPLYELPVHPLRRYCGTSPSFSDGLLICTGCDEQVLGLAADDLSIEWVYRYRANVRPKEIGGGNPVFGNATSDDDSRRRDGQLRPHDSLIRIMGSHVLLMPRDSDQIICVDLHTGREHWSRPRGDLRYVAALNESVIVLAGTTRLVAAKIKDGSIVWQQEFTEAEISAQPAATQRLIYLPTRQGHILIVNIADGRRLLDQRLSDSAIGNLLSVSGQLIAQSATSVDSWKPDETSIDSQLAVIENLLLNSDPPDAVIQRLVDHVQMSTDDQPARARHLLIRQLLESIRLDYRRNLHRVPLLTQLIAADTLTPVQIADAIGAALGLTLHDTAVFAEYWDAVRAKSAHKNRLDQLIVDGLTTQTDLTINEFVTQVLEIIETALTHRQRLLQVGRVRLLATHRTAAAVQTALSRFDEASRKQAVGRIRPTVQAMMDETSHNQLFPDPLYFCWMAGLVDCLLPLQEPALNRIPVSTQRALVPQLLASRSAGWLDSQRALLQLKESWHATDTLTFDAWEQVGREPQGPGNDDLGRVADLLLRQVPPVPLNKVPQVVVGDAHTANQQPLTSIQGAPRTLIPLHGTPGVYRGWQLARLHAQPGILAIDSQGKRRWVFNPADNNGIQIQPNGFRPQRTDYAVACGRLLALNDNDRLYMLDGAEGPPQILWTVELNDVLPNATEYQEDLRAWERTTVYDRQPDALAPIGPLTEFGLPLFRGRRLIVLNPWTGQHMWIQDGIPDDTRMAASDDQLCLISESTGQIQVRNLRDGSVRQSGRLPDWWGEGNSLYDTSVRHIDLEDGVEYPWRIVVEGTHCLVFTLQPDQAMLKSYDLASMSTTGPGLAWQTDLPTNSVFSNVCEGLIATLSDDSQIQIRQVADGSLIVDQSVPLIAGCEQLYLRRSQNRLMILTYAPNTESEPLIVGDAVPLNGPILGIDIRNGSIVWTRNAHDEYLRTLSAGRSPALPSAPLLILLSRQRRKTPPSLGADYAARILDVNTGNVLYEDNNLGTSLSYHALRFDGDQKFTVNFDERAVEFDFSTSEATRE